MNKPELINRVVGKTGLTKKDTETTLNALLETISEALQNGEKVKLDGFGNFEVRDRAARNGHNPRLLADLKNQGVDEETARKQAHVPIAETRVPAFKAGKKLKEAVK